MSGAIAIFVKTPGLSPVKTRLSAVVGKPTAEAFHLAAVDAVRESVCRACRPYGMQAYYAVAEQSALNHPCWRDLPRLWQDEGGLGERMGHIYRTLLQRHDFVMLVGADIPQMRVADLISAACWLGLDEADRLIYGPSVDGGFWLVGGNCPVPLDIWTGVTYSETDTGTQFFNKIKSLGKIRQSALLQDVDEADDLIQLQRSLLELPEPTSAQRNLASFVTATVLTHNLRHARR